MEQIQGYEGLYEIHLNGVNGQPAVWSVRSKIYLKPFTNKEGYLTTTLKKNGQAQTKYLSRLVALNFINNPVNLPEVDHINRITNDNRVQNLRWLNSSNQKINKNSKGFCWSKQKQKWRSQISVNGKVKHIGHFTEEEDARQAYLDAKKLYYPDI